MSATMHTSRTHDILRFITLVINASFFPLAAIYLRSVHIFDSINTGAFLFLLFLFNIMPVVGSQISFPLTNRGAWAVVAQNFLSVAYFAYYGRSIFYSAFVSFSSLFLSLTIAGIGLFIWALFIHGPTLKKQSEVRAPFAFFIATVGIAIYCCYRLAPLFLQTVYATRTAQAATFFLVIFVANSLVLSASWVKANHEAYVGPYKPEPNLSDGWYGVIVAALILSTLSALTIVSLQLD